MMNRYHRFRRYLTGLFLLAGMLLFFCTATVAQQATITEEQRTIKTYPFGDPDPVPVLAGGPSHIYPYFSFDGYTLDAVERDWKVVTLENDYIEVYLLPEVGGKVWGAVEKSTGEEFIYLNEVLKFRNIALRGPWTSGGIEFNFGITGHTPATSTPVDHEIIEHDDGSVSCVVGGLDLPSRTEWRVTITLPADKAYFETESFWYNPTPLGQSYYVWMNAAVEAADDLQFFFPGTHYVGHPGDVHPWPVDEQGRDLSYYRNNDFGPSKSYHILGEQTEFYGGYWHEKEFGFGNWSLYSDMPGKKLWIWSLARSGGIWEDLLTDSDGQYVEVQSGRQFSQAQGRSIDTPFDYEGFHPHRSDRWKELWFPVRETGGISQASPYGVLHLTSHGDRQTVFKLMALQQLEDTLTVSLGGEETSSTAVSLAPMEVFRDTLEIPLDEPEQLNIVLGNSKLTYAPSDGDGFDRPLRTESNTEESTLSERYQHGKNQLDNRQYDEGLETLMAVTAEDPAHIDAHVDLSRLYYRRGEYEEALGHSVEALSHDTYHAGANFVHGLIKYRMGENDAALEAFGWAARSPGYRSAAYAMMAELHLQTVQTQRAITFAKRSLDAGRDNIHALKILAVGHRLQENSEQAGAALNRLLELDPLNHFARYERYQLNPGTNRLEEFTSNIRNELPHETYLELAIFYANAGRVQEAVELLEQGPDHPMISYWLAYLKKDQPEADSRALLDRASSASPNLVFPFRTESIPVLQWAGQQAPSWTIDYYLGLIYWHTGRTEEAAQLFEKLEQQPDYAAFYLGRGELRDQLGHAPELIQSDYEKARELDPEEWRSWHALTEHHLSRSAVEHALATAEQAYERFPEQDAIEMDYAQSLLAGGQYEACTELLDRMRILPFEGASLGRVLFERAHTYRALEHMEEEQFEAALRSLETAQTWPERLGVGRPYEPDLRLQQYLQAEIYRQHGSTGLANELIEEMANYTRDHPDRRGPGLYFGALALKELGNEQEAQTLLENWHQDQPDSRTAEWALARFEGNRDRIDELEQDVLTEQLKSESPFPLLIEAARYSDQ